MAVNRKSTTGRATKAVGRPGGKGGNKVAGGQGGDATGKARPGGPGGNKTVSGSGGEMKPRPGGSQPAG